MPPTREDVRRLADAIRIRRDELGLSAADLVARGGPSPARWRSIEAIAYRDADVFDFRRETLEKIDQALDWERGSARDVLARGIPRPLPAIVRVEDPAGRGVFIVDPGLAAAMDEMTPLEQSETRARMVLEGLRAVAEFTTRAHAQPLADPAPGE